MRWQLPMDLRQTQHLMWFSFLSQILEIGKEAVLSFENTLINIMLVAQIALLCQRGQHLWDYTRLTPSLEGMPELFTCTNKTRTWVCGTRWTNFVRKMNEQRSVDIDGVLACVAALLEFAIYIFEHDEGRWVQSLMVPFQLGDAPWECLITGQTVVIQLYDVVNDIFKDICVYKFDPKMKEVTKLQQSDNFLVFSTTSNSS